MYKAWLYKKDGEDEIRECPTCSYHEIKSRQGDWIALLTFEHCIWVAEQWLQGNYDRCVDCHERFEANKPEYWGG